MHGLHGAREKIDVSKNIVVWVEKIARYNKIALVLKYAIRVLCIARYSMLLARYCTLIKLVCSSDML
jgi:hypothetical protein